MKKAIIFGVFILLGAFNLMAQDQLFLRGKEEAIKVKVIEVGTTEIKYKTWPVVESMPLMVENKDRIRKIILENGTVMKFAEDEFSNAANYATQRKIAVKLDPFIIPRGVISIAGEYSIKPGMSAEVGLGYIGIGNYDNSEFWEFDKANGFFLRAGVKFINQPSYYMKGMRYAHILKGGYIRPELVYLSNTNTSTIVTYGNFPPYNRADVNAELKFIGGGFFLNFGKQWVFSDVFLVDFFVGPGIAMKKAKYFVNGVEQPVDFYDPTETGMFAFTTITAQPGKVAFSAQAGLKVGVLIGAKGEK
jgi:hypothetical protein